MTLAKEVISTFYIYAEGADLAEVASEMRGRIETFVEPYECRVRVVDRREEKDEDSADVPDWDLGVNFEFESLTNAEKKDLLLFFQSISAEFGRDFIPVALYLMDCRKTSLPSLPLSRSFRQLTFLRRLKKQANKALEPTTMAVTPRAIE